MYRSASVLAALVIVMFSTSCQPEAFDFEIAVNEKGDIVLRTDEPACFDALRVYDSEVFMWQIVTEVCSSNAFPVTYGKPPQGFSVVGLLRQLVPGRRYGVTICGGDLDGEARREFIMPAAASSQGVVASDFTKTIQSPHDRDDVRRRMAIEKGEDIPTIEECSRSIVAAQ